LSRDPLIRSAIDTLLERKFIASISPQPEPGGPSRFSGEGAGNNDAGSAPDPSVVTELMARSERAVARAREALAIRSGTPLLDFIAEDIVDLKDQLSAPRSFQALMAGIEALWWLKDYLGEWLGDGGIADTLSRSVDNNITSQMGLDLLDVADAIRPHAAAVSFLREMGPEQSVSGLLQVEGGSDALEAIDGFLSKYGMRCAGEIDITRTRWRENPAILVPMILANIDGFGPGEAARRFSAGLAQAKAAEIDVLQRLRALPDGFAKAEQAKNMIDRLRAFIGYREYPKYGWVSRLDVYKQAMLDKARKLVVEGVLDRPDDIFYLRFDELREVVRTRCTDRGLIIERRAEFASHERLASPRVLTSDGETLFGRLDQSELPPNAIPGLPVSAGIVEGRARVVTGIDATAIEAGDILVTRYTDPSWTPLFLTIAGLVTEAGGQMSHGAVIAREYGLPAVIAVEAATRRIQDGQRIRIDGTSGVVTVIE
jgi:pyruvate,water dikinase